MALNPGQSAIDSMRQTLLPQMLDDSRKQAQALAAAAGVRLGAIYRGKGTSPSGLFATYAVPLPSSSTQVTYYLSVVFATAP